MGEDRLHHLRVPLFDKDDLISGFRLGIDESLGFQKTGQDPELLHLVGGVLHPGRRISLCEVIVHLGRVLRQPLQELRTQLHEEVGIGGGVGQDVLNESVNLGRPLLPLAVCEPAFMSELAIMQVLTHLSLETRVAMCVLLCEGICPPFSPHVLLKHMSQGLDICRVSSCLRRAPAMRPRRSRLRCHPGPRTRPSTRPFWASTGAFCPSAAQRSGLDS